MITRQAVNDQLRKTGHEFHLWGRNEIKEIGPVMSEGEQIKQCVNGYYKNGFAMMVATDRRLILIDHKPMFLTLEVCWYDKIGEIDFNHRLLNATICISTPNKDLQFTSWNNAKLREILLYSQEKISEAKQSQDDYLKNLNRPISYESMPNQPQQQGTTSEPNTNSLPSFQPDTNASYQDSPAIDEAIQPTPNAYDLTVYGASRLPFSRRRYFSRQPSKLEL